MHPIERLRHVARAGGAPVDDVFRAAAASLAGFADDPVSLVTACRRLIDRHPANGPIWWMCARVLAAPDPADEAWRCLDAWTADPTVAELGHALPAGSVAVVGAPERLLPAFASRGDVAVTAVDVEGDGYGFSRQLEPFDVTVSSVDVARLGREVSRCDVVVLDARAIGPDTVVAAPGSWPVAAVAHTAGVAVWAVAGAGRVVVPGTWPAVAGRLATAADVDLVPMALVDRVVGPEGPAPVADALGRVDAPDVPELRR